MIPKRIAPCIAAAAAAVFAQVAQAEAVGHSALHDYRVVTVAEGFERPWSIAFLPGGDMLVTEKAGRLRVVRDGRVLAEPVAGVPAVSDASGQAGLLDVVPHPDFATNRLLYLTYSKPLADGESTTALIRGRFTGDALEDVEELFEAESRGRGHFGSRIAFDGEGHVFVTVGDRQASPSGDLERHPAQDLSNHHGVVVRLGEDGAVPADNPYTGREDALDETWSHGHRNAQGMAFDFAGRLWITEHGPQGGDELNLVEPGVNYGWPVIGYGVNYRSGSAIHAATHRDGMAQPEYVWVPSIGVSGLAVYEGEAFPNWKGFLLAGGLSGQRVDLLHMDGQEVTRVETLVPGIGRVRDVRVGPDGFVYLAIDDRNGGPTPVVRLEPVPRTEVGPG